MTPATPVETTGEIVLNWGPGEPVVTAPERAAIPAVELFGMRRVPGQPRAVELPGGVRYRIGAAHRRWPGAVQLTYDPDSLALAVTRFGAEHVVLGTDYPFAAREDPPGAVLEGVEPVLRAAIARTNALPLLDRVRHADA